jgi:hypothetical protein
MNSGRPFYKQNGNLGKALKNYVDSWVENMQKILVESVLKQAGDTDGAF